MATNSMECVCDSYDLDSSGWLSAGTMSEKSLKHLVILIKGAGEMATGVAERLYRANFRQILMLETASPLAVRRRVSFCEAVHDSIMTVEGIDGVRVSDAYEVRAAWQKGQIAVRVDPTWESLHEFRPEVVIDAILAKRNLGTRMEEAPLVLGMGPGFVAGKDCHLVVETNRGHNLGRLIEEGAAEPNTGVPGNIGGYTRERVLRAPASGTFVTQKKLGDAVIKGEVIGRVGNAAVTAQIDGILRGLIRPNFPVKEGLKIGDIDPRGHGDYCDTISDKARTLGGTILVALLAAYNR